MVTRVLLLTSHPLAPPWDSADKQIAASLVARLSDVRFLTIGRLGVAPVAGARRIPILSGDGRPGILERAQVLLADTLLEPRVDIVHAVLTIGQGFARFSRLRARLPARRPALHTVPGIVDPRGLETARPLGPTVALSEDTKRVLVSAGFPDVTVVPPGVPLDRWPRAPRAPGPPVVLYAGHHDPGGGAEESIDALARLPEPRPVLVLAMRGRPGQNLTRERNALRALAVARGVRAEIHGVVEDMPALVRRSSIVVLPARSLAGKADLPFIVLEAMASGRPVVVSDLDVFEALGDAVTRVPPGDASSWARAIESLLREGGAWERAADAGRALVEQRFSDAAMAARYRQLYAELAMRVS